MPVDHSGEKRRIFLCIFVPCLRKNQGIIINLIGDFCLVKGKNRPFLFSFLSYLFSAATAAFFCGDPTQIKLLMLYF